MSVTERQVVEGLDLAQEVPYELIQRIGDLFQHPWLVAIVNAAPTPDKGARHILDELGWPIDLARAVKAAVQLRNKWPEVWKGLSIPKFRPWERMVDIKVNKKPANTLIFHCFSQCFGCGMMKQDRSAWPLLLQEMWLSYNERLTWMSLDGFGAAEQYAYETLADPKIFQSETISSQGFRYLNVLPKQWTFSVEAERHVAFEILGEEINVCGKTIRVGPNGDCAFPRFYRALGYSQNAEGQQLRIRVLLRLDLCQRFNLQTDLGSVEFERIVPVPISQTVVSRLLVKYKIKPEFQLELDRSHLDVLTISLKPDWYDHPAEGIFPNDLEPGAVTKAVSEQSALWLKIYQALNPPNLHAIAGTHFLTHPPMRLSDLFC